MRSLPDDEIESLIKERKILPSDAFDTFKMRQKSSCKFLEGQVEIIGEKVSKYLMITRRNNIDILDFSIILRFIDKDGIGYNIVRYNGKHMHSNKIEGECFEGFHIHHATQRYQVLGSDIETFAEKTERYNSFEEALKTFMTDMNIEIIPKDGKTQRLDKAW